jgi:hypothetical protein
MLRVGFEPTIPMFERAKTVHISDRVATVIGRRICYVQKKLLYALNRTSFPGDEIAVYINRFMYYFLYRVVAITSTGCKETCQGCFIFLVC